MSTLVKPVSSKGVIGISEKVDLKKVIIICKMQQISSPRAIWGMAGTKSQWKPSTSTQHPLLSHTGWGQRLPPSPEGLKTVTKTGTSVGSHARTSAPALPRYVSAGPISHNTAKTPPKSSIPSTPSLGRQSSAEERSRLPPWAHKHVLLTAGAALIWSELRVGFNVTVNGEAVF